MVKKKTETENLPAVMFDRFVMPVDETPVPAELVALLEEGDEGGFEIPVSSLPFVRIRGKDLKDDNGQVITPTGGFAMDLKGTPGIADVDGQEGLTLTVLFDRHTRIFWKEVGDKKPTCRSNDRLRGEGEPADRVGGNCLDCPLSKWNGKERPECRNEVKLFCLDHNTPGMFYILTFGPSGLTPYDDLKKLVSMQKLPGKDRAVSVPLFFKRIHITTQYKAEPQGHYIPVFSILGDVTPENIKTIKTLRSKFMGMLSAHTPDSDSDNGNSTPGNDPGGELPPGATPVDPASSGVDSTETGDPPESNRIPGI